MIRLIDYEGRPFWVNPKKIDFISQTDTINQITGRNASVIWHHSGPSCFSIHMKETLDDVKKMIDEAKEDD